MAAEETYFYLCLLLDLSCYFAVCFFMALLIHYNRFKISNPLTTGVQDVFLSPSCPYQASLLTIIIIIIIINIIIIIITIIIIVSKFSRDQATTVSQVLISL